MTAEESERRGLKWLGEYDRTGAEPALRQAVMAFQEAAAATPPDHPDSYKYQYNASYLLTRLFEQTGDATAVRDAAPAARSAVRMVPAQGPGRAEALVTLGDTLQLAYERLGGLPDLQLALGAFHEALAGFPPGSPDLARCHNRICVALRLAYERTGDLAVLHKAVEAGRRAVKATSAGSPDHAGCRWSVGNALRRLYECNSDGDVLREALEIARESVAAFPSGRPQHPMALNVLAATLRLEYGHTGELPVLREAVRVARDAIESLAPPYLYRAAYQTYLADGLRQLAERTSDRAVAREAVLVARAAVEGLERGDPQRAKAQSTLCDALVVAAGFVDDREMMAEADRAAHDALEATPSDHPEYVTYLTSRIGALMSLYHETRVREFLDRAVRAASDAAASTTPDDPRRVGVLANFCFVLEAATQAGAAGAELTQAERLAREAVESMPPGHPGRTAPLSNLGRILDLQFRQTGNMATARACTSVYASIARTASVDPTERVKAAHAAARMALRSGHRNQAMTLAETAVGLIPQVNVRDVERASREHRLRATFGLAAAAAAAALSVGNPSHAVELLEQTRGLVLASTLETRSDLTGLHVLAPDLAGPFDELRRAVNALDHESATLAAMVPVQSGTRQLELATARLLLSEKWDRLIARIRQRDGMEGFLQPPPIGELRKQACHGPIVYLMVHEEQAHALIVRDDPEHPVDALTLPGAATDAAIITQVSALREARDIAADPRQPARERRAAQQRILDVLSWTWDAFTEPVLQHLGCTGPAPDHGPWPRVWWCPVGVVGFLPLHAAGRHTAGSQGDTVMDRVVSSYTPTIRALAYARERSPTATASCVVVAVPDAPESPPLDSAVIEAGAVREFIPDAAVLPPPGAETSRDGVIDALRQHGIAHLACHGVSSWTDPASSRLILHDHLAEPLTLHEITRLHLQDAQLAYLSACSTTDSRPDQADEATQLTAAFQLAGYRNVIGTRWPITDHTAATVARDFYSALTCNGTKQPVPDTAAQALHQATRNQRNRTPALPTRWAAYIHYGV